MTKAVVHICMSDGWGGLEQYPLTLAKPFAAQGVDVFYWALENTHFAERATQQNFNLRLFASRWQFVKQIKNLVAWVKEQQVSAIHFHKSTDLRLALLLRFYLPKVRLIFTEHMNVKRNKKSLYHRLIYKYLDHVIAISDYTRINNLRSLPVAPEKLTRLYSGIDLTRFYPSLIGEKREALRAELGLTADTLAFALPGRICDGKRQDVFVQAIELLRKKLPISQPIKAFIIGGLTAFEGADEAYVASLQQLIANSTVADDVVLTGYRADMQQLLQAMDGVCIPSLLEAFGLTVIEAMALGVPVVGSAAGGIPEILGVDGRYGLLAETDNPAAFAEQFYALAVNPELRKSVGAAGLKRVQETFDLEHHVTELLKFYE